MSAVSMPYEGKLHAKILTAVKERYKMSQRKMALRYSKWIESEELYRGYIKETDEDSKRRAKRKQGSPQFTTIHIPYSYAMLLSAHTYWSSVFLSRTPVIQYTARHGETQQQVQAIEALVDYQLMVGEWLVPLYMWLLDAAKYGVGILGNYWANESTVVSKIVKEQPTFMGIPMIGRSPRETIQTQTIPAYQGTRVFNVRPFDFFPDPRVALMNLQQGEFCARFTSTGWNELKKRGDDYFNLDTLENMRESGAFDREAGSGQLDLPDDNTESINYGLAHDKGTVGLIEMHIELSAKEWEIGDSSYPEKWIFTMANNAVIIGARPAGAIHSKFPYCVQVYELEAYGHSTRGMLEISKPINDAMDWLLNSHIFNTRKVLNDNLVVDPSRVVMQDLEDGGPGKIIRLLPSAYGTDTRTVASQLQVADVTGTHLNDMRVMGDILQRVTGATDNIMGMVNAGGRKTATEVRTSSTFGINRLKTQAEFNSALGWAPLSQMIVQNTQQNYDKEKMFKIAGDLLDSAVGFMNITPEMIAGAYSFVPVDGTMPIDRYAQANLWKEILMGISKMPQIGMTYDLAAIFAWMAQLAGLKNITQFKVKAVPDAALTQQVQAGNMVPQGAGAPPPGMPDLQLGPINGDGTTQ